MIGTTYWATGITVRWHDDGAGGEWGASLDFLDAGFCQHESTEGSLRTRYYVPELSDAIDTLKADAERLGIDFRGFPGPTIYFEGDGEDPDNPPPDGWEATCDAQSARLGWSPAYTVAPS